MAPLQSNAVPLVVSYVFLTSLSAIAVILRFISIHILSRQVKAHDIFCLVSLVSKELDFWDSVIYKGRYF